MTTWAKRPALNMGKGRLPRAKAKLKIKTVAGKERKITGRVAIAEISGGTRKGHSREDLSGTIAAAKVLKSYTVGNFKSGSPDRLIGGWNSEYRNEGGVKERLARPYPKSS